MDSKTFLARLREVLSYDPDTGIFTWLKARRKAFIGRPAGSEEGDTGWMSIRVFNQRHNSARLAWLFSHGVYPDFIPKPRNGLRKDLRISNLENPAALKQASLDNNRELTHERLTEYLLYDRETGIFCWQVKIASVAHIGQVAGHVDGRGYRYITIDSRRYQAGRLAWFYINKVWPNPTVDHRDRNRDNNAYDNLREATHRQNSLNRSTTLESNKWL